MSTRSAAHSLDKKAATDVANSWLKLVDSGKYQASWDDTTKQFQKTISKQGWARKAAAVRSPLGAVRSRKVRKATYTTSLPGAPDGEYVVLRYDTSFEHKKSAIETVAMSLEQGKWKVAGYFIR